MQAKERGKWRPIKPYPTHKSTFTLKTINFCESRQRKQVAGRKESEKPWRDALVFGVHSLNVRWHEHRSMGDYFYHDPVNCTSFRRACADVERKTKTGPDNTCLESLQPIKRQAVE